MEAMYFHTVYYHPPKVRLGTFDTKEEFEAAIVEHAASHRGGKYEAKHKKISKKQVDDYERVWRKEHAADYLAPSSWPDSTWHGKDGKDKRGW